MVTLPLPMPTSSLLEHPARGTQVSVVRRAGGLASAALRLLDPAALAGNAVESVWLAAHVATWPVAAWRCVVAARAPSGPTASSTCRPCSAGCSSRTSRPRARRSCWCTASSSNCLIFTLLRRGLTRRGFSNVFAINYLTVANDVRAAAAGLSVEVERVVEETGFERIHIIGHSLGGLVARYDATRLGADARVHTLITLGTPTKAATPRTPCRPP